MPYHEFLRWMAYRQKRGTLNLGMRIEHGSALLATLYANVKAGKPKYKIPDFMPHFEEPPISLDEAMRTWR